MQAIVSLAVLMTNFLIWNAVALWSLEHVSLCLAKLANNAIPELVIPLPRWQNRMIVRGYNANKIAFSQKKCSNVLASAAVPSCKYLAS